MITKMISAFSLHIVRFQFVSLIISNLGSFVANALTTEDDVPIDNEKYLEEWAKTEASNLGLLK